MADRERFFVFIVYLTESKSLANYAMSIDVRWLRFKTHQWWGCGSRCGCPVLQKVNFCEIGYLDLNVVAPRSYRLNTIILW